MNLQAIPEIPTAVRRWKAYLSYKDSGIKWLGVIPEHWEVKRLKFLASFYGGGTPSKDNLDYWNGDIPWVSPKDMKTEVVNDSEEHITKEALAGSATQLVQAGAVLVVVRSGILKHSIPVAVNTKAVSLNQDMKAMVPRSGLNPDYVKYLIVGHQDALLVEWRKAGATVESIEHELLVNSYFPIPSLDEQCSIVDLLDRETAKIDALVAKKEQLIKLLQQKRAALISCSVTKGLDANVPMKNSGVEWLGEIPAHWKIKRLKFLVRQQPGAIKTGPFGSQLLASEMMSGEVRVYNQRNVIDEDSTIGENYVSKTKYDELRAFTVGPGDILLTTRGTIGRCLILADDAQHGILHPCLMRIRPDSSALISRFVRYLIQDSSLVQTQLFLLSNATTIEVVYSDTMKNVVVPVPPTTEQKLIIDYLDHESATIDGLIAKIREGIEKLKEYRTALISAAVTGKIDVRDEMSL